MKPTLLLICSLLCLFFFSLLIIASGSPDTLPPAEAYTQVEHPAAACDYLKEQESFNRISGYVLAGLSTLSILTALISLIFLRKRNILIWFRVILQLSNLIIMLTCGVLFIVTMIETTQPMPDFMKLCNQWTNSYWARTLQQTQQSALFLGLSCGMLSIVNCMAFYLFSRNRQSYEI